MRLEPDQLPAALARGLAPVYLISGDEPLTAGEAADAVRAAARKAGFTERVVFSIDRSFAWDELRQAAQAMSLFAERRLFELRMPTGKPDKGAALLAEIAGAPPPDVMCLIVTGKLDAKTSDSPWVRAIERAGVWVRVWPVSRTALPAWLESRARALELRLAPGVAQSIADRVEGNLLAAKQELDMLALLANGAAIDADLAHARRSATARATTCCSSARPRPRAMRRARCECSRDCATRGRSRRSCCGRCCASCAACSRRARRSACASQSRPQVRGIWRLDLRRVPSARLRKVPLERLLRAGSAHGPDHQGHRRRAMPGPRSRRSPAELAGALQGTPDSGRVSAMNPMGIFGGTFDPIHYAHLRTAFELQQALRLKEIRFLPAGNPPHRDQPIADAQLRLKMVELAIAGQAGLRGR